MKNRDSDSVQADSVQRQSCTDFRVYFRHGCHLCEDMLRELDARQVQYRAIDIDADPALRQKYNTRVPVLCCGEQVICQYFLEPEALEPFL